MKTNNLAIRAWYISTTRILELLDDTTPFEIQRALESPNFYQGRAILANTLGPTLLEYLKRARVSPIQQLALDGGLRAGVPFTYQGHFYGKGFGMSNKSNQLSLAEDLGDIVPGKRLIVEFSKGGLLTDTAYSRLGGSTNLFAFCSIAEITDKTVRAVPYVIGDLVEVANESIDLRFQDRLRLHVSNVEQFSGIDFSWNPTARQFQSLKNVTEHDVKGLFCRLLGEIDVPKDWGGEECDIFTSNLSVDGRRHSAAFLLKGPARFHEMKMTDCGKNGDQIYRLFNCPAEVFVVQHCHKISPAVRRTVEAFALSRYSLNARYMIIDGYDTARILRSHGIIPAEPQR